MQPGTRRLLPAIVFVVVGGLAVWAASPESLTGSADGSGCAGTPPMGVQTEALDQEDPASADAVAALVALPDAAFRKGGAELDKASRQIIALGPAAFQSLLSAMQSEGLDSPAGLELTRLAAGAMAEQSFDPMVLEAAVNISINNIAQALPDLGVPVPVPGFADLADQAGGAMTPQQVEEGYGELFDGIEGIEALDVDALEEAVANSLAIARWARMSLSEQAGEQMTSRILEQVENMEPNAAITALLLQDMNEAAPATAEYGQRFLELALSDDRLDVSRAIACEAARVRPVDLGPLFAKDVNDFAPQTARCLLRAATTTAHVDFAVASTVHGNPTVREAGWQTIAVIGEPVHAESALDVIINREGETDYEPGLPERLAALEAVLAIGLRYPDAQPGFLSSLSGAAGADPALATWVDAIQTGFEIPEGVE